MTWPAHQHHPGQTIQFDDEFPGPASYRAPAVTFDGTNDYLTRGADLSGIADSKLWTGSFWIFQQGADGVQERLITNATTLAGGTTRVRVEKGTNNRIGIAGLNAAGTTILDIHSGTGSIVAAGGWYHVMWSVDLSDTGKRHLYVDDASALTVVTYTNDTISFTEADWAIGANPSGTGKFSGDFADVLVWPGVYVDLSVEANRRLFIDAAGKPVNPAIAIASLGTPLIGLYTPEPSWHTNAGSGGGFTENGALTDASTSPSD